MTEVANTGSDAIEEYGNCFIDDLMGSVTPFSIQKQMDPTTAAGSIFYTSISNDAIGCIM